MSDSKPVVTLHATGDDRHLPFLLEGLMALETASEIRLRVVPRKPRICDRLVANETEFQRVSRPYPWSYLLDIGYPEGKRTLRVAIDLQDWKQYFSHGDLNSCDLLFKRSYDQTVANLVASRFQTRVLPAGMTHAGDIAGCPHRSALALARIAARVESVVTNPGRVLYWMQKRCTRTDTRRSASQPQTADTLPVLPRNFIFFQIACHGDGSWREAEELNQRRASLIRAMRSTLPGHFCGGMYFPQGLRQEFVDCLSNLPSAKNLYVELVKRASVVISTQGFGGSAPWKLCEYLALGKCIVTEHLPFPLPTPFIAGKEVISFADNTECAQLAADLLKNPGRRQTMERAARQYYTSHVSPIATARRYIETALATAD